MRHFLILIAFAALAAAEEVTPPQPDGDVFELTDEMALPDPQPHAAFKKVELPDDLVAQDPDTGKYSLGPGVLQLGNAYLDGSELRARSLRWAESLAQQAFVTRAVVRVHLLDGHRVRLELAEQLHEYDIVVSSTASSLPILGKGLVERALKARIPLRRYGEIWEIADAATFLCKPLGVRNIVKRLEHDDDIQAGIRKRQCFVIGQKDISAQGPRFGMRITTQPTVGHAIGLQGI